MGDELSVLVSLDLPSFYVNKIRDVSSSVRVQATGDTKELLALVRDADVLLAGVFSRELFLAAKRLKWIQSFFAGVDRLLFPEVVESRVIVTNASGVNSTAVSEHAVGLMLALSRKLHFHVRNQMENRWKTSDAELLTQMEELSGKTVGIVGLGRIGGEIAKKAKCLGMTVVATRRNLFSPKSGYIDKLVPAENLKRLLTDSDFVMLALPLTKDTERMIGEAELKSMKKTSYLINVSRGKLVEEEKLIQALNEGWIAGAGLDAFEMEPLPRDSPLWQMKNVIITPHVAGLTPYYLDRLTDLFCDNLNRFLRGESLINVVDKKLGY